MVYLKSTFAIFFVGSMLYGYRRKCSKFAVGKKTTIGDRPVTKRHNKPISWDRLPFATTPLLTVQDLDAQKNRVSPPGHISSLVFLTVSQFLEIWNEDGLSAEPQDDLE
jgi:cohesin loading factor subunit SCC2